MELSEEDSGNDLCQSVYLSFYGHVFKITTQLIKVRVMIIFSAKKIDGKKSIIKLQQEGTAAKKSNCRSVA